MSHSRKSLFGPLFLFPLLGAALFCGVIAAQEAPPGEPRITREAAPAAATPKIRLLSKIWWNQADKIEVVGLTATQRERMDEILRSYLESRPSGLQAQRLAMEELGGALVGGDETAIRERAAAVSEAAARPMREQVQMMIEVVALLSAEQRRALVETYPRMLSRPWIHNADPRRLRAGAAGAGR